MLPLLLGALAGGLLVKNMTGYPAEIQKLQSQMPKEDREDFIRDYKSLPSDTKNKFKQYLREANMAEAGKLIGMDLSNYKVGEKNAKQNGQKPAGLAAVDEESAPTGEDAFMTRIKNILNTPQFDFDPQLVVEAAKQYENIAGLNNMSIADKTKKLLDVSQ